MALIKDNTHGKFKKIIKFVGKNPEHRQTFDCCLDDLDAFCQSDGNCECTLTSCFSTNELDFTIKNQEKTCGKIRFGKECGFYIESDNPKL
jgi:hypothetical protein